MKKFTIAILAILYLSVSSGIAMEIHYCMGEKAGVEFYGKTEDACGKCGMKEKTGCCNDEHKFYKLSDSHKNVSNDLAFVSPEIVLVPCGIPLPFQVFNTGSELSVPLNNSPPVYAGPSACILNCVFRI